MLIKAGIDPSSLNNRGLSALDQCLIEMAPLCGSEIDEWLEIAVFLSKRIVSRTKFTTKLLSLQRDPKVSSQVHFTSLRLLNFLFEKRKQKLNFAF